VYIPPPPSPRGERGEWAKARARAGGGGDEGEGRGCRVKGNRQPPPSSLFCLALEFLPRPRTPSSLLAPAPTCCLLLVVLHALTSYQLGAGRAGSPGAGERRAEPEFGPPEAGSGSREQGDPVRANQTRLPALALGLLPLGFC
jgi:hypothetical protein